MKPTQILQMRLRRRTLSTKQVKHFYKGTGTGLMGTINNKGKFRVDWDKVRTFVPPQMGTTSKTLKPFVSKMVALNQEVGEQSWAAYEKKFTGKQYLEDWKTYGIDHDPPAEEVEEVGLAEQNLAESRDQPGGTKA
ncbi:hypothetical protein P154DRAFT_486384 [Amniculicola lignicola CBS 123094]|uniref:50S ribosomal protein-like protein YmL27 n=1 Tax=Amniculicola lignicola CBS 123094 TaxID=1392246 RepID=A0A6A5WPR9_9PLEO|nr:hypothetical protein P154DRAFT_486384 [Amniculicola lignicola CBS 123094]